MSETSRWLIGGLVQMGGALMAFGNRVIDSFVRLKQGKEAPNAIVWGEFDRLALIRLPVVTMDDDGCVVGLPTIEFRLPDGSVLPHLLLAGAALAMLYGRDTVGLDDLLERTSTAFKGEPSDDSPRVPRNFVEVAHAIESYRDTLRLGSTFPDGLIDLIVARLKS